MPLPLPAPFAARWTLPALLGLVALPLYALDQATKLWTLGHVTPEEVRAVVPGFFYLVSWTNTGSAFGLLAHSNGLFIGISALAVAVLAVLYRRGAFEPGWSRAGFALLLPGVLGNLTDRIWHGHVIDFLLFDLHVPGAHPWPAFNVADSCICVAVGCLLVSSWQEQKKG